MHTWNTLPASSQQRVYNNTLAAVKRQIQQVESPTPAVFISTDGAHNNNAIHLDYLTSEVALEEPQIRSTNPNIPIDNNCTDDEIHFRIPAGSADYEDEVDESDLCDAIPTASQWWRRATKLERIDLGTSDVDWYEGENGNDADLNEKEEASEANDESTQNVEDWGHSRFDLGSSHGDGYKCKHGDNADADEDEYASEADDGSTQNVEDSGCSTREGEEWTVYFRPVKYDNGQANATASDVSEARTILQYATKSQS